MHARSRRVTVANVGNYGENTVAEHTFALILALSRRLRDSEQAVRTGRFSRERLRGFDLRGKTLGVVGAGRVGLHVIRIGIGFGMQVIAYDAQPHPFYSELLDFHYVSFEQLMRESHVITLHVPLDFHNPPYDQSRNACALPARACSSSIPHAERWSTPAAVIEALDAEQVAGLGLDVLEDERVFRGGATKILGEKIAERVRSAAAPVARETSPATRGGVFQARRAQSASESTGSRPYSPCRLQQPRSDRASQTLTVENIRSYLEGRPLTDCCT